MMYGKMLSGKRWNGFCAAFALAAVFALTLAGCGGGGSKTKVPAKVPGAVDAAGLAAARKAATAAYEAAKRALDAVAANRESDVTSYNFAVEQVEAAKKAADRAGAASTLAEAELAKTLAEAAQETAERYAGEVRDAHADNQLQAVKAAALAAYAAAQGALNDVAANRAADADSYDTAAEKVDAAKAASDRAQGAETLAAAQAALAAAEAAKTEALRYAGMVQTAHAAAQLGTQLEAVKNAATAAYAAAKEALDGATADRAADEDSYAAAVAQVALAKAASDRAQGVDTLAAARAARAEAETAKTEALAYARMVRAAKVAAADAVLRAAMTKGAMAMERAIDASTHVRNPSRYGHRSSEPQPDVDHHGGAVLLAFPDSQNLNKGDLPAGLEITGFDGQMYVRTTENAARGETVRERLYFFTDIEPDTQQAGTGDAKGDPNYISFGFWVKETEKDGVITYNRVQALTAAPRGSNIFLTNTQLGRVEGRATYAGPAAGAYIHKTLKSDGTADAATAGVFTADVNLTARFGGAAVAVNRQFSVSGTISDFRLSGGETNAWSLRLDAEDVKDNYNRHSEFTNGTTDGGGRAGTWSGIFLDDEESQETRTTDTGAAPGYMTGKFKGYFLNGAVHGAFGLEKE